MESDLKDISATVGAIRTTSRIIEMVGYKKQVENSIMNSSNSMLTRSSLVYDPIAHVEQDNNNTMESSVGHVNASGIALITFIYPAPILIASGIFTNTLICLALRKPFFRNDSLCTFMYAFAISNILALLFNSSVEWISDISMGTHFYNYSELVCRIWQFLIRLVIYSGGWFMAAMTIDRFLTVWFPKMANDLCSVFFAKAAITFIMIGLTTICVHALWLFKLTSRGSEKWCYYDTYSVFYKHFWRVLGMQLSVVPLCLIFFFGILAGIGIRRRSLTKEMCNERIRMDITYSTLLNSALYFTLNAPATVINVIDNISPREWLEKSPVIENMEVSRDISQCLVLINYTSGLIAWLACSRAFRNVIKEIVFRKPKLNRNSITSISTEV